MTIILLIRHGQNDWVNKHRLAGWIPDVHLNDKGHDQAQAAADRLATLPISAVYSSPVIRCVETARYLADRLSLPIQELADLGEVRYGKWEGKKIKKLARDPRWYVVQHFPSRLRFPKGEALREVQFRAVQALERLTHTHPEAIIAIFSHADLIKLVLAHYLGIHIDLFQRIVISPASVSAMHLSARGTVRVLRLNDDGPLDLPDPKAVAAKKSQAGKDAARKPAEKAGPNGHRGRKKAKPSNKKNVTKKTKKVTQKKETKAHGAAH